MTLGAIEDDLQESCLVKRMETMKKGFEVERVFVKKMLSVWEGRVIYTVKMERFSKVMMAMGVRRKRCRGTVTVERTDAVSKSNRYSEDDVRLLRKR